MRIPETEDRVVNYIHLVKLKSRPSAVNEVRCFYPT